MKEVESEVGGELIEITLSETLALRSSVLLNGRPHSECLFVQDGKIEAAHFGLREDGAIAAVASFYRRTVDVERVSQNFDLISQPACQLRGMAVRADRQRCGFGKQLLLYA